MIDEEANLHALRRSRIARVKRILRWLPRRTNVHRYPVLRWFATSSRQRSYLWSFRVASVVPALYAGCLIAFSPLYGLQVPLAITAAFLLRANLPILFALQGIVNPITFLPIYYAAYHIGRPLLQLFGLEVPAVGTEEFKLLLNSVFSLDLRHSAAYVGQVMGVTAIGGAMMGLFCAAILSGLYRLGAYEVAKTYRRMVELKEKRESASTSAEAASVHDSAPPQSTTSPS